VLLIAAATDAGAQAKEVRYGVDTEHMFGFTEGTDIGRPGEAEIEIATFGRFGRTGDTYNALSTTAEFKYPLTGSFRVSASATVSHFGITNVTDLDDRDQFAFNSLSAELSYNVLDRRTAPLGLTLIATPFFGFVDDISGAPADRYGLDFVIAADRALVPNALYVALNLVYEFERSRDYASGLLSDSSSLGFQFAAARRLWPWLYLGGEVRYCAPMTASVSMAWPGRRFISGRHCMGRSARASCSPPPGTCRHGARREWAAPGPT
jgi:hypothetical protein